MNQSRRYFNDTPSYLKCPSCNFRFQYPGTSCQDRDCDSKKDDPGSKEVYRVPYVLSCGHSYCVVCVEKQLHSSFHVFCSKCQVSTHVVGKISEALPIDFTTIGRTVSARSQSQEYQNYSRPNIETNGDSGDFLCQDCSVTAARKLCLDCCIHFCNPCYQRIHFRGYLSQHSQLPICKSGIIGARKRCETHPNQFFDCHCLNCNETYCVKCDMVTRKHINHKVCSLTEMFKRKIKLLQGLNPRIERLLNMIKRMDKRQNGVKDKAIVDEIRSRFSQLHGILLQKEEEIIRQCLSPHGSSKEGGYLHDEAQFLTLLTEDIRSLSNTRPADIHIKFEEATDRVGLAEQIFKYAFDAEKQFVYELDASRFQVLLRECIKMPSQPGPLDIPSPSSGPPSCSELSSQPSGLSNIVEVVEPDGEVQIVEPALAPPSNPKPIKDGTSREFVENLSVQPKSFLSGTLADGDRVFAIHVVNPSQLYLQKEVDFEQIQSLFNVCQELGGKGSALRSADVQRLEPGDMFLAEYSADNCWYRCRILCTFALCGGLRCQPGTVTAIFVDYGNCECVRLSHLKKLAPPLENLANFAYECNLHLLPPSKMWHKDTSMALRDAVESDKPFVVRILDKNAGVNLMDLCRPIEQGLGAFSLREHLVFRKLARFPEGNCERPVEYGQDDSDFSTLDADNTSLASTALPPTPSSNAVIETFSLDDADITVVDGSRGPELELHSEPGSSLLPPDGPASGKISTDLDDVTLRQIEEARFVMPPDESSIEDSTKNDASLRAALVEALEDDVALTDDVDQTSLRLSEISAMVNGGLDCSDSVDEDDECFLAHKHASKVELPNGMSVHAICVCHDRLNEVWITPEQIHSMAFEAGHPALITDTKWTVSPLIGGLYASRYNDGFFYRCVVEALLGQDQASVFFVDFGNQEVVNWKNDMVKLSKRFLSKPYMARLLPLAGITFANKVITCDLVNQVQDLILTDNTYQLRYERSIPGGAKDSVAIYLLRKTSCVNLQLVELQLADFSSLQQELLMRGLVPGKNRSRSTANSKGRGSKSSCLAPTEPPTFRTRDPAGRRQRRWDGSSVIGVMTEEDAPLDSALSSAWDDDLSNEELGRLGSMQSCCLQRVVSPGEFYISMNDPATASELDKLYQAMDEYYNARRSAPPKTVTNLQVGSLCAARRSNSKHWFRGRIVGPSAAGSRHVKVEFMDVGDVLNIPLASIRQPLNRNLMCSWPAFAVRCQLLGVRPAGDKSGEWPKTAIEKLLELVKRCDNKAFLSRVLETEDDPAVDLIIKEHMFDSEKDDESTEGSPKPVCTRLVSLRRSMINFGVALSKAYDKTLLLDSDCVLRGTRLVPAHDLEATSPRGDTCEERTSSDEDSDLEDHLYQSNNSNTAEAPTAQPDPTSSSAPSLVSCAEVLSSIDNIPDKLNASAAQSFMSPELMGASDKLHLTHDMESRPPEVPMGSPLDIMRLESIESVDGPLDAYMPVFWPPYKVDANSDEINVKVLDIDKHLTIFCRPLNDASLEVSEDKVNAAAENFRLPPKRSIQYWDISEACLALWNREERGIWCRGQIEHINAIANCASVYLVDHGKSIDVPNDLLRPIKVSFSGEKHPLLAVPPSVWRVKLHDIYPVNPNNTNDLTCRSWRQEDIDKLRAVFVMNTVILFVVEVVPSTVGLPYLYSRILCPDVDYDEELGERLVASQIAYRWERDNPDQRFIKTPELFRCYPNLDPLPVGVPLEVIITAVETPSEVYLQCPILPHQLPGLCNQYPAHSTWFHAASKAYESLSTSNYESSSPLVVDEDLPVSCLARYTADHRFYRAELCYAVENSAQFRVQFVDYGNYDLVTWNDLRSPVAENLAACSRRYRWSTLKRHPSCDLSKRELRGRILDTLEPLVIFARCERIYRDGRLPLIDLFEDAECTKSLADILIEKELVCRK